MTPTPVRHLPRAPRLAIALLLVLAAGPARSAELNLTWEKDLAFEWDRASYEKTRRRMVQASEADVSAWLGWPRSRPLEVRVLTRAHYEAEFGSGAAWNTGARYSRGVIHVNGGARLDGWFAGLLAHELTHALLDDWRSLRRLPLWLNEGLAERLGFRARGQDALDSTQRQQLEVALQQRQLVPLPADGGMTPMRYLQGYAAVLFLEKKVGKDRLLALVRRALMRGTFEEALDAELRWTPRKLEEEFSYWVDHLQ